MSSKTPRSRPRPKISFAVDREEIGITSEWADTFLPDPQRAKGATGAADTSVASSATDTLSAAVDNGATVAGWLTVGDQVTAESTATDQLDASVVNSATEALGATVANSEPVVVSASVDLGSPQAADATVAPSARKPRAKALRSVADGLTPGQFIVYTQMYAKGEGEGTRFYRGGYQSLCAMTGLSKRGIQNVIGDLQAKQVVSIETAPGHNPSQVSVYRVRSEPEILKDWYAAGLRFVLGKGKILLRQAQ